MTLSPSSSDAAEVTYQLGQLRVLVQRNRIVSPDGDTVLEPKVMDILVCLIEHQGHVVSKTDLLDTVWAGRFVVDGVLKRGISKLRRALGDDARDPRFIETVQRRGYRLVCTATRPEPEAAPPELGDRSPFRGLSAFRYEDAPVFFGRERQVRDVLHALSRQREAGRAFVLISGPSGCGKSS
ncbi:MAG: winged helix-turn-helix domain-containing protein, partial [Pseudomonadota bacterium]